MGGKRNILIIDDEDLLVASLVKYLANKGFEVKGATRSENGLAMLKNEQFDMVITDLRMVPISGIEIIRYLRESGFAGSIIAMSAYFREFEKDLRELRVDRFLEKPFALKTLLDLLTVEMEV